jgi:hypothetical protein
MFPPSFLCDRRAAELRFHDALARARTIYRGIGDTAQLPKGFVHPEWEQNIREVETYFLDRFDMSFLNHPRIRATMVFTNRGAHAEEWPYLESRRSADDLRKILAGGLNASFLRGKLRTAALINSSHHLYHVLRFEAFRGNAAADIGSVVEFGGGYGNLARLFRNMGHRGGYAIVDLPVFSCIQYVYLATVFGADAVRIVTGPEEEAPVDAIRLVPLTGLGQVRLGADLFVSTWALSESPAAVYDFTAGREWFGAREILMAFNEEWIPWETDALVGSLKRRFRRVEVEPIPFLRGNRYLFATDGVPPKE